MDSNQKQIEEAFREVAALCHTVPRKADGYAIDIKGKGIVLRIHWRIERLNKIFVTLRRATPVQSSEYGLPYLVKFKNGSAEDFEHSQSGELKSLVDLTKKYALPYLLGTEEDFADFEAYTAQTVAQNLPATPEIRANKWIRPEWI
jgi:hypothetical protein